MILRKEKAIHNAVALSLVGGIFLMIVGWILAPWYLQWINTEVGLQQPAVGYLVYPITWLLTAICMSVYYVKFHKNRRNQVSN